MDYGTACARSELIADELGFIGAVEKIARVKHPVAQVLICRAVPVIRAAARNQIDLTAGAASIFGAVTVGGHLEFLDAVHRRLQHVRAFIGIVVVHAIDQKIIELFAGAVSVHRKSAALREFRILHGRQHTGNQERQLQKPTAIQRQIVHPGLIDYFTQLGRLGLDSLRTASYFDRFSSLPERQQQIHSRAGIHFNADFTGGRGLKTWCGCPEFIRGGRQLGNGVKAGTISARAPLQASRGISRHHIRTRYGLMIRVKDVTRQRPSRHLGPAGQRDARQRKKRCDQK